MDAFRLLSRSTNFKSAPTHGKARPQKQLPSSGAVKNPQLFAHHNGDSQILETRNDTSQVRKRKRGEDELRLSSALPADLDFFGDQPSSHETQPNGVEKAGDRGTSLSVRSKVKGEVDSIREEGMVTLSEEECKRILKDHKLKVTLLQGAGIVDGYPPPGARTAQSKNPSQVKSQTVPDPAVRGKKANVPLFQQPLTHFSQLRSTYKISRRLADNISAQGYTIPTEVQLGGLPLLLGPVHEHSFQGTQAKLEPSKDRFRASPPVDLLTVAPTGSGKTLAFLIPVIHGLIQARRAGSRSSSDAVERTPSHDQEVKAIVVAPTRELADQIVNEGTKLAIGTGIRVTAMRKGMRIAKEEHSYTELEKNGDVESDQSEEEDDEEEEEEEEHISHKVGPLVKADVLVSTPLMLLHAISEKGPTERIPLPSIRYLVLDEADVLLDPLFRSQTLGIWNACVNPDLRISLWSATMGSNIEELARSTITTRQSTLGIANHPLLIRLVVGLKDSAIPNISHRLIYAATETGKLLALRQLLHPTSTSSSSLPAVRPPFLVFTQTIPRAIALHSELRYDIPPEAGGSARIAVLHSDLSDPARALIMARFRKGEVWVLITTDLLARGVDFRGLNGVVNYDVPGSGAAYVHRVGRTGRAGRDGGVAVTLYTKEDVPYVKGVANVIASSERLGREGQQGLGQSQGVQKWLLDALPTPSKREKKELKRRGVEARRTVGQMHVKDGKDGRKGSKAARISTKSGYDRRIEHNRKGAKAKGKVIADGANKGLEGENRSSEGEWSGLED